MFKKLDIVTSKEHGYTFRVFDKQEDEYMDFIYGSNCKRFIENQSLAYNGDELRRPTENELDRYYKKNRLPDNPYYSILLKIIFEVIHGDSGDVDIKIIDVMETIIYNLIVENLNDNDLELAYSIDLYNSFLSLLYLNIDKLEDNEETKYLISLFKRVFKLRTTKDFKYFKNEVFYVNQTDRIDFIDFIKKSWYEKSISATKEIYE